MTKFVHFSNFLRARISSLDSYKEKNVQDKQM